MLGYPLQYLVGGDGLDGGGNDILECTLCQLHIDGGMQQRGEGKKPGEGAFYVADVGGDFLGDEHGNIGGDGVTIAAALLFYYGKAGLQVGGLDVGGQPGGEPADDAVLQPLNLVGGAVGGYHHLLLIVDEGVEGVEKLLLGGFFAGNELNIVYKEDIHLAVKTPELVVIFVHNGTYEVVHEGLASDIEHPQVRMNHERLIADGVKQMCFAQAHTAVDEQGVEALARCLADGLAGGPAEFIGGAYNEFVKGEAGIQTGLEQRLSALPALSAVALSVDVEDDIGFGDGA